MRENRQQARTKLLKLIRVKLTDTQKLFGHVADVSVGGMMIKAHSNVSVGDHLHLSIELPNDIYPTPLDVHAEVSWVQSDTERNICSLGCQFVAIEKVEHEALLELARQHPMGKEEL